MKIDPKRFAEYMKYRYDESWSMIPLSAQQSLCRIKVKESEAYRMADGLDWTTDRSGNVSAEHVTDDGYRIEFTAEYDEFAEIDWDLDPDTVEDLIPYYIGHVSKSVAREYAEHLIEAQTRYKEKMMSGNYYSAMVFSAETYDPDGNLIGEDSIGGCYVEWIGDEDTTVSVAEYVATEAMGIIKKDRESRAFESRHMVC